MGFRADVFLMSRSSTGPVRELLFHDPSVKGHVGFFYENVMRLQRKNFILFHFIFYNIANNE